MERAKPKLRLVSNPKRDVLQRIEDSLAALMAFDALHGRKRLGRHLPPVRTKPELRLVKG